jgi:hypothetical protein
MKLAEKAYLNKVFERGCAICLRLGYGISPCEIHHQRTGTGAAKRASHYHVVGLCPEHHRGNTGIHGMGRKAFERHYEVTELELIEETRQACL